MIHRILAAFCLYFYGCNSIVEPYPSLNGGVWQNNSFLSEYSFDPIINYVWNLNSVNSSALQIYNVTPKYAYTDHQGSFQNLDSIYMTPDNINVIVYGPGNITIDFGQENAGWLEIDSNDCDDTGLLMSISEYNEPGFTGLNSKYPKTLPPVKYTNNGITTYRLETNSQLYDGVRYGFIHVSSKTNKPWHITGIRTVSQIKPNNYIGSFMSTQYPILNKIWYSSAYCVKMNMLPNGFGAILMDRGDRIAWIGDNHISQRVAMYTFGAFDYVKQSTINTQSNYNGILSYALYWIESVYDYYMMTNDSSLLTTVQKQIETYLNQSISIFGTNPKLSFYGWDDRIGAGFEGANTSPEAQYAYQMLTIQAIGKSLIFFDKNALNNLDLYNYYNSKRTQFITQIRSDSNYLNKFGLHSSSDAINGKWLNKTEINYLFSKWFNDSINICSFSPFNMFYISQAIGITDNIDYLLSALDLCWGNSVRLGATTFWEVFSPQWFDFLETNDPIPNSVNGWTSECHPWSSGALSIITAFISGFKILKPGLQHIQIKPALMDINTTIPVWNGDYIAINFNGYKGEYEIKIPIKMDIDMYLPISNEMKAINPIIYMDDNVIFKDNDIRIVSTKFQSYWMIHLLKDSIKINKYHYFKIAAAFSSPNTKYNDNIPNVFPPPNYPGSVILKDFNTQGNWIDVYGKEGYILYGYSPSRSNVENLPKWVTSIKQADGSTITQWIASSTDIRALQNPNSANQRALGTIFNSPTYAINVDIDMSVLNSSFYYMSMYLCDWDYNNRKQTIHVFDLSNFNIITPIVYNEDYSNGVWIKYKLDRSIRIRMNFVRGTNAVLSGLFFDIS